MKNNDITTSFIMAANGGDVSQMKRLRSMGADIEVLHQQPLRDAARRGHRDAVDYLLSIGARFEQAVSFAAWQGDVDTVAKLLAYKKNHVFAKTMRAAFAQLDMLEAMDISIENAPPVPKKMKPSL